MQKIAQTFIPYYMIQKNFCAFKIASDNFTKFYSSSQTIERLSGFVRRESAEIPSYGLTRIANVALTLENWKRKPELLLAAVIYNS